MLGSGGFDAARVRARPAHGLVRERGQYLYVTSGIGTSGVPLRWRRIRGAGCDRAVCRCYGHCWGSNRVFVRVDSVTDDTIYRPSKPDTAVPCMPCFLEAPGAAPRAGSTSGYNRRTF